MYEPEDAGQTTDGGDPQSGVKADGAAQCAAGERAQWSYPVVDGAVGAGDAGALATAMSSPAALWPTTVISERDPLSSELPCRNWSLGMIETNEVL